MTQYCVKFNSSNYTLNSKQVIHLKSNMLRQATNNIYNAHYGIASYAEKKDRNKYKKTITKN